MASGARERAGVEDRPRQDSREVDTGVLPFQKAAGHLAQADARLRRAGIHREGREHRLHRPDGRRQDRTRLLKALQSGYRCRFVRAQDLFDEMYASLADRSTRRLLSYLARLDVLLIDEMGYLNLKPEQTNVFFKLMEERYRRRATIITTNLAYEEWHNFLGNKALVDALLSRLRHQCHTVRIDGPSLREPQS